MSTRVYVAASVITCLNDIGHVGASVPNHSHKIALIEDDPFILEMYRVKFELEGYHVRTAPDGRTGLKLIKDFSPHLVLLDIMMPHMNGFEVLEQLRIEPQIEWPKIIVLTNMGDNEVKQRAALAGAIDCFVKAEITPHAIATRVRQVLEDE